MSDGSRPATHDATHLLRWSIYTLLIVSAATVASARIFAVVGRDGQTPFLSANDRSRWCTIRALADDGTFAIDHLIFDSEGGRVRGWHTIDLVRHIGWDGNEHYYSSKPVLMPTLMAGVYWVVKAITGASLSDEPFYAGRIVLWLCNVPPLMLMWWLLGKLIDRFTGDDWTRLFAMVATTTGTLLTAFSITLNNHLHAATCVTVVMFSLVKIVSDHDRSYWHFALAGFFAALAFANELPALSLLCLVGAGLLWLDWRRTLLAYLPPALVVIAAAAALNYVAHGSWRPPYTHRGDGAVTEVVKIDPSLSAMNENLLRESLKLPTEATIVPRLPKNEGDEVADRWNVWNPNARERLAVQLDRATNELEVRRWDNWYEYNGTNWQAANKRGVDRGEPSKLVYAFNVLIGHHGLFSLTPIWLIAFAGLLHLVYHRDRLGWFAAGVLLLSVVCIAFYLTRPLEDRNYGGWCNGARWLFWFIPMYLVAMLPALEILATNRWGRLAAMLALAASIFSAWYTPLNPWMHPWIYDYWTYLNWIAY